MPPRKHESHLTLRGLLRILFRWKRPGWWAFLALFIVGLGTALFAPLSYESQVILERKPIKVTPVISRQDDEEFDVYRLTSESQRSAALLKSRPMMERWMTAIGWRPRKPQETERLLRRLVHSLTVQPIPYTDLFVIKVRAPVPEEAKERAQLLVDNFSQWDAEQNQLQAQQLRSLLRERFKEMNQQMGSQWSRLKYQKSAQSLSLSGSSSAKQLENSIEAQGKIFDRLAMELEEAERQLDSQQLVRTRIVAPASLPGRPILSRLLRVCLAMAISLIGALVFIFILEWQDGTVRRTQDISREIPDYPVLAVPFWPSGQTRVKSMNYLSLLADAIEEQARMKETTLVQMMSPSDGDGKSSLSASLAELLSSNHKVCLVHQNFSRNSLDTHPLLPISGEENGVRTVMVPPSHSLSTQLVPLRKLFNLFILDTDSLPDGAPGGSLMPQADMICILVAAGRTSRYFLRALRHNLQRFPNPNLIFILNRYEDPLPLWLQSR